MMEDLYTDKVTIRQIRRSHMSADRGYEISGMYEDLKKAGTGMIGRSYVMVPSTEFCRYLLEKYGGLFHHNNLYMQLQGLFQPYCSRYAFTMLIND